MKEIIELSDEELKKFCKKQMKKEGCESCPLCVGETNFPDEIFVCWKELYKTKVKKILEGERIEL